MDVDKAKVEWICERDLPLRNRHEGIMPLILRARSGVDHDSRDSRGSAASECHASRPEWIHNAEFQRARQPWVCHWGE